MTHIERPTEDRKQAKGSGLGLALSKQYAQALGGDLTVESIVGVGSTFYLTFRAKRSASTSRNHKLAQSSAQSAKPVKCLAGYYAEHPPRILVVDDDESNRCMLASMLRGVGYEVKESDSGASALAMIHEDNAFDLVLVDKRMPEIDGVELLKKIRAETPASELPVFIVTASGFHDETERMRDLGASGFIPKPLRRADLLNKIKGALNVNYAYHEHENDKGDVPASSRERDKAQLNVAGLPEDKVSDMIRAVERGDIRTMRGLVKALGGEYPTEAAKLQTMVEAYDYRGLRKRLKNK